MLQLCSISLVTGLGICLRSATKITHKAQSVTCLAAKWHVCATIDTFDATDGETPTIRAASAQVFPVNTNWGSDDEEGDGDDALDNTKMIPIYAHTISFHKRQALGEWNQTTNLLSSLVLWYIVIIKWGWMSCSHISREQQSRDYSFRVHAGQDMAAHHFWGWDVSCALVTQQDNRYFLSFPFLQRRNNNFFFPYWFKFLFLPFCDHSLVKIEKDIVSLLNEALKVSCLMFLWKLLTYFTTHTLTYTAWTLKKAWNWES